MKGLVFLWGDISIKCEVLIVKVPCGTLKLIDLFKPDLTFSRSLVGDKKASAIFSLTTSHGLSHARVAASPGESRFNFDQIFFGANARNVCGRRP